MPSWKNGEESSDDDFVGMDMELWENPDTTVDASFCGKVADPSIKCRLHQAPCSKYVAFDGIHTGRRFYGCGVQGGVDCGVAEWVDAPWPAILQRCLVKIWEMFHEENHGRLMDHEQHQKELAKVMKELDQLGTQYSPLVEDVTKLFDWQDKECQNKKWMHDEELKKEMDVDKEMKMLAIDKKKQEKLAIDKFKELEKLVIENKELKILVRSQGEIIRNTRKERNEMKQEVDWLKEEKIKLEFVVGDLLKAGQGNKEKLGKMKAILDE